jgi:hypothetical protein
MQFNGVRTTTRRAALAASALALALAAPAVATAAPAHTNIRTHTTAPSDQVVRSGSPESAVDRVADFYGAYIDAVWDTDSGHLADDLRGHYLTPALQQRIADWEAANHADGVLFAQDVPTAWQVTYAGSGAGHTFTTVRLTFGEPGHATYQTIDVQSDLATKKVSDLKLG